MKVSSSNVQEAKRAIPTVRIGKARSPSPMMDGDEV